MTWEPPTKESLDNAAKLIEAEEPNLICKCGHHHVYHDMVMLGPGEIDLFCTKCACQDYDGPDAFQAE